MPLLLRSALLMSVLAGCGPGTPAVVLVTDAGATVDAGPRVTVDAGNDAGVTDAGTPPVTDAGVPRCTFADGKVNCPPVITPVLSRDVYWQFPSSPAPAAGFPAVIVYQGSFFAPSSTWNEVASTMLFGGFQQARMQALLLERGFTVIAPTALAGVAWQTNTGVWEGSADQAFIDALLVEVGRGTFGPVDASRLYATGISSGGYMTSRMAVSYPGVFRALVINAGSYATCAGIVCILPATLPANHPPTRFLHGRADLTVPLYTAENYQHALVAQGFESDLIIDDAAGHEWLSVAPERVVEWVESH